MKMCYGPWLYYALVTAMLCAKNILGAIQPITGGQYDPPLVPTTNAEETVDGHIYDRVIVNNSILTGIEINGILYTDVEGPTNASVIGENDFWPINEGPIDGSLKATITNLTLHLFNNVRTGDVYFASTVTRSTDGGFFFSELGSSDDIYVYPLDSTGQPISTWQLHLVDSDYGNNRLLFPHGNQILCERTEGAADTEQDMGGAAFTLDDFTGGSGTLNNVAGLRIVDPNHSCDPCMIGIYRGPGESAFFRYGRAFKMYDATFDQTPVNPMTNDFSLTGFHRAESITAPSAAYQFDTRTDSSVLWPTNGVQPTRTNALLGLEINGVRDIEYWDFMFDEPVTNSADGFFMIDEQEQRDAVMVFPLDADRRPISNYAIAVLPSYVNWNSYLQGSFDVKWDGSYDGDGTTRIAGTVMPLSAFAGGTGGLTEVYGIRVFAYPLKWDGKRLDLQVVGSYIARERALPIHDAVLDTMPTTTPADNRLSAQYRHPWTLTGITLDDGQYTDLEGPTHAVLSTPDWEYCVDNPNPPTSALESALGLDSTGLMNANNCKYIFATTVTNGFNGGFFLFIDNDLDFKIRPLGTDTNAIANYSIAIDNARELSEILEADMGIQWYRTYGHPPPTGGGYVGRDLRGTSFTLGSFRHETTGEPLTNDVIGIQLTDHISVDPILAGIYRGPAAPVPASGIGSPITSTSFNPAPQGSPYTNDVQVTGVQSLLSESQSTRGPSDVAITRHGSQSTYYPIGGTNPGSGTSGYTNALTGLNVDGILQTYATEYMFDRPVRQPDDGFFIIEHSGNDIIRVRPLDANRTPISTYSAQIDMVMYASVGSWTMNLWGATMRGTMIRKSDFSGGAGELGLIYGIRIEEPDGQFDPAVVGEWFGPGQGTMLLIQ